MALAKLDLRDVVVDPDGVLNAGGFVYTYSATTTTPLVTYSDGLGTENTNPVVLDASGQWACYLDTSLAYRLDFATPDGVVFYTADNITVGSGSSDTFTGSYITDVFFTATTPPASSGRLGAHSFTKAVSFPANFGGAFGSCDTAPTASFIITLRKNATSSSTGTAVGTVTIATNATFAFASTAGAVQSFVIGDTLKAFGPAVADATANDFNFTLIADLDA